MLSNSLKTIEFVDRTDYICHLCQGKKVLHLGATDAPETLEAIKSGRFLHSKLMKVCQEVVGMDINIEMIKFLQESYQINNIYFGNIEIYEDYPQQEFDLIIAGEILEHLSNPGQALDCLKKVAQPTTKLIITVPNAHSIKGFIRAIAKHELIHPDHTLYHSPYTLKSILERHGFFIENTFSFVNGGEGILASTTNFFLQFSPQLAEGIGVICSLNKDKM